MVENNRETKYAFSFIVTNKTVAPFTSLRLFNGHNEIISEGYGNISIKIPRGVYQLQIEFNEHVENRHYRVDSNTKDELRDLEYQTSSSIPIFGLRNTHEYFSDPSTEWSKFTTGSKKKQVSGSSLFLFFRYSNKEVSFKKRPRMEQDFFILNKKREVICKLDQTNTKSDEGREEEYYAYAAFHQPLKRGQYFLLHKGKTNRCEIPLYIFPDWQTQLFLIFNDGPIFSSTKISIEKNQFFHNSTQTMQLDALIQKMYNGIYVLPEDLKMGAAYGKWQNPMLGILSAYMYLLSDSTLDDKLYQTILGNLERRILKDKKAPDLIALRLLGAIHFDKSIPREPLPGPCMIAAGMNAFLEQSLESEFLIPKRSLIEKIFPKMRTSSIWTMYEPLPVKRIKPKEISSKSKSIKQANINYKLSISEKYYIPAHLSRPVTFNPEKEWIIASIFNQLSESSQDLNIPTLAAQLLVTPNTIRATLRKMKSWNLLLAVADSLYGPLAEEERNRKADGVSFKVTILLIQK
jgi:hypothetical protein